MFSSDKLTELSTINMRTHTPVVTVALVIIWALLYRLLLSPISKIPGPWHLKLSSLFFKYHELVGTKRLWTHSLHLQYGTVVALGPNMVHFSSAAAAKAIYVTGSKDHHKTEFYNIFRQEGHVNLFTALGPEQHSKIRKPLADRYSNTNILASEVLLAINERAATFVKECTKSTSADIYFFLHAYALDCVTAMLFHPYGTKSLDQSDHKRIVHYLSYRDERNGRLFPFDYHFSTNEGIEMVIEYYAPILSKLWLCINPLPEKNILADKLIREYVSSTICREDLSSYTVAARLSSLKSFDTGLAISECLDHLGAGIETTGDTLCFLMWELSQPRNYAKMDMLHAELRTVSGIDRLNTLPYLNLVIQEALRQYAPGTMSLPRYIPKEGRMMDGYFIPGGTIVACQSYTLHRDPVAFPNAEEFIPERWLEPNNNLERQRLNMAFGFGARTCIGKHLAQAEMRALLHAVYSRYRTRPAPDMNASMEFEDSSLTSRPRDKLCKLTFELYEDSAT